MFSKACEYGIRAAIFIAGQSKEDKRVSLKSVAHAIDSPEAFTAKILQSLAKEGIISSVKGATGGYEMSNHDRPKITLLEIVRAIDGKKLYTECGLGLKECNAKEPCPLHDQFATIRQDLKNMLQKTTILSLSERLGQGMLLKR